MDWSIAYIVVGAAWFGFAVEQSEAEDQDDYNRAFWYAVLWPVTVPAWIGSEVSKRHKARQRRREYESIREVRIDA